MRRTLVLAACCALLTGCGGATGDSDSDAAASASPDSVTQRQRDSIVGASPLPGAGGVRRALDASDAAADRAAAHDSLIRDL